MESRRDIFQAIADPTSREIIGLLAQKPMNLNAISANFDVSRQAISLHIKNTKERSGFEGDLKATFAQLDLLFSRT